MPTNDKDCYGISWEERHPECAGGLDPMYTAPDGSHIRQRCSLYEQCGRVFKAAEAQKKLQDVVQQQVVPVTNLTKPTQVPIQPVQSKPVTPYQLPPSPQPLTRPYTPQPPTPQPTYPVHLPPPQMMPPGQVYPSVFSPVQMLMPHEAAPFLTVSEDHVAGVPAWRRILIESLRAGFKGVLQQGAFIVDHTPYYFNPGKR